MLLKPSKELQAGEEDGKISRNILKNFMNRRRGKSRSSVANCKFHDNLKSQRKVNKKMRNTMQQQHKEKHNNLIFQFKLMAIAAILLAISLIVIREARAEEAPRITIQPNDLIAIEGEATELNCDAEGDPEPTIEWFHNGQLIRQSSKTRTTMAGSIQFLDVRPPHQAGQLRPSDVGVYHCLARNSLGEARSRNASLQVAYIKEQFRMAPKDKFVAIGDSASFDCLPLAWPEPQIQWRFNGQPLDASSPGKYAVGKLARTDFEQRQPNINPRQHSKIEPNNASQSDATDLLGSRLTISRVDKSDEGKYSCSVETKGSHRIIERESPQAQLLAFVKPYFVESPRDVISQVGGQARLRCRLGGDPEPVISWRKQNGQPLSEKTQIDPNDKTLVLEQIGQQDQGNYICEGENSAGSARAVANVAVHSRPKFSIQPADQEVEQGAYVKLNCAGDASPPPMLFWYKEGHRQLMFPPNTNQHIPKQHQHLVGPYQAPQAAALVSSMPTTASSSASMSPISDTSPAINKLFTMPAFQNEQAPTTTNQMLSQTTTNSFFTNRIHVDNHGSLHIANVTPSDSGYYACALISPVGSVLAKAKLIVKNSLSSPSSALGIPHVGDALADSAALLDPRYSGNSGKFDLLPPPVIKLGSANQTLPTNTSATLNCEVFSQVPYKIQWFFENQPLQVEQNRVMVFDNGALQINNLKISDSGIYTCVVTAASDQAMPLANPSEPFDAAMLTAAPPIQQTTSHSTMLRVANPMNPNIQFYRMDIFAYPSSPGPAMLMSTNGNDAITISWAQPSDSGSLPIKEYIIEHYDTSQEHLGWRIIYTIKGKESLLIDGLSSEGSHYFVIRAANSRGVGPSSSISNPMRTVMGEARYQQELMRRRDPYRRMSLDYPQTNSLRPEASLARDRLMSIATNLLTLTPVSSSSIRLQWSTQVTGNLSTGYDPNTGYPMLNIPEANDFLEGFSIRYRAIKTPDAYLGVDPLLAANVWPAAKPLQDVPVSLPLVTSFVEQQSSTQDEDALLRDRRDLMNSNFDLSQEFNEIRVADHNTEQYTVNGLKPFTLYQFFIVPYYKDIDGVPSNLLAMSTNEDRPSIAPPNLTIHAINNTAVRLLWIHIPQAYANGILRGYVIQFNKSDVIQQDGSQSGGQSYPSLGRIEEPKMITVPLGTMTLVPYNSLNADPRAQAYMSPMLQHQYVAMFDLSNLTFKSFYSVQVAGYTDSGPGPLSDLQNFFMDPVVLSQLRVANNEIDDVMSKTMISGGPEAYSQSFIFSKTMLYLSVGLILSVLMLVVFIFYRRHDERVSTWKKTISEHFNNKFYMPSNSAGTTGPNPFQQNIYDHNKHLIYSRSNHVQQQPSFGSTQHQQQQLWANGGGPNGGCLNASSGTNSLSSHGGLLPVNADPNSCRIVGGEQFMLMNTKEINNTGFVKPRALINSQNHQATIGDPNSRRHQESMIHQGDYYSVINNMGEYEELETHQRNNVQSSSIISSDRNQTASSNSDTSCPNSVTRLIPNPQNYNREILTKKFNENFPRPDHLMSNNSMMHSSSNNNHHLINDSMKPSSFATIGNGLSPYATTNLMAQNQQQQLVGQMTLGHNPQHPALNANYNDHNGNLTMNLHQQQHLMNGHANQSQAAIIAQQLHVFTTLKRNQQQQMLRNQQQFGASAMQPEQVPFLQQQQPQQQIDLREGVNCNTSRPNNANLNAGYHGQYQANQRQRQQQQAANHHQASNSQSDDKSNLYEPVEYSDESISQTDNNKQELSM